MTIIEDQGHDLIWDRIYVNMIATDTANFIKDLLI